MARIFKYEIPTAPPGSRISHVILPQHAAILSVGVQGDRIYAWALVDPDAELRSYDFKVIGTGHEVPDGELDGWTFVGTVFMPADMWPNGLVWHVWVKP